MDADGEAAFACLLPDMAKRCGVTRLADITALDRLSLPVWQAVRPSGKALSVHQGKGASPVGAKIGALCEAIESHCAENVPADGPRCAFGDLAQRQRAADISDYCSHRDELPDNRRIQWCCAIDWLTGEEIYLPHLVVSLDYTCGLPSAFDRTSTGLGAGPTEAAALQTAVFELVERDALGDWKRASREERLNTAILLDTIPFDWFRLWRERLEQHGVRLEVFRLPSIVRAPALACVIGGREEFGPAYRRFYGASAHESPEIALFKAFAEALQSRLTLIAGVRDDILPSYYRCNGGAPLDDRSAAAGRDWSEVEPCSGGVPMVVERLGRQGYAQVAVKRLDLGLDDIAVTKVFVPGLGSATRTRRVIQ